MRAMLKRIDKRVWTYQELRAVTKLFDTDLTTREKHKLVRATPQEDYGPVQPYAG